MGRKPTPDARERLLDSAGRLFEQHGVHAVGLQQIIDDCGCGKQMLYREFASKDDLVEAWLERCVDRWAASVEHATEELTDDPAAQLVAIVRVSALEAAAPGFHGCVVRGTQGEFRNSDHPARRVAVEHLTEVRARLHRLAQQAGANAPRTLADQLMLVIDGLLTSSAVLGPAGPSAAAVDLATDLVRAATRPNSQ